MKISSLISLMLSMGALASEIAVGDLNGDGILDRVEIIEPKDFLRDQINLIITLKNKNGSVKKLEAPKALYYGPDIGLTINKGVLIISYQGGARSKWIDVFKWRLDPKGNDFVLTGRTFEAEDTIGNLPKEKVDANYLIGKADRVIGKKKKSCSFKSKKIYLISYDFTQQKDDQLEELMKACPIK